MSQDRILIGRLGTGVEVLVKSDGLNLVPLDQPPPPPGRTRNEANEANMEGGDDAALRIKRIGEPNITPSLQPVAEALRAFGEIMAEGLGRGLEGLRETQREETEGYELRTKALVESIKDLPSPTVILDTGPLAEGIGAAVTAFREQAAAVVEAIRQMKPPVVNVPKADPPVIILPETPVSLEMIVPATRTTKTIVRDAQGRPAKIVEDTEQIERPKGTEDGGA